MLRRDPSLKYYFDSALNRVRHVKKVLLYKASSTRLKCFALTIVYYLLIKKTSLQTTMASRDNSRHSGFTRTKKGVQKIISNYSKCSTEQTILLVAKCLSVAMA